VRLQRSVFSFHLEDIAEAHRYMEKSEQFGKIIIAVPYKAVTAESEDGTWSRVR
jgi:hypothetical protein